MADPSTPNRTTLRQRASRARRRDYINDLEQRLRAYEAHGVQATAEVQIAARGVVAENSALREEVGMLRQRCAVLEEKISAIMHGGLFELQEIQEMQEGVIDMPSTGRRWGGGSGRNRARRRPVAGHPGREQRPLAPLRRDEEDTRPAGFEQQIIPSSAAMSLSFVLSPNQGISSTKPHTIDIHGAAPHTPAIEEILPPWPPSDSTGTSADLDFPSPPLSFENHTQTTTQYPTPPIISHPHSHSHSPVHPRSPTACSTALAPNTTPCLQAALIIASMRGIPPDEHTIEATILPELGCAGPVQRPRCISSGACTSHDPEGLSGTSAKVALDCAVDNGRLFGILAREG